MMILYYTLPTILFLLSWALALQNDKYLLQKRNQALLDWITSSNDDNAFVGPVALGASTLAGDAGQGLFCTRHVTAGEVLMQIPSRLVISVQQAYKDPTHGPVFSHLTKEAGPGGTRTALVGYLALQFWSISQSDYEPYLHLLLQPPNHHVLRYSDDQLESLSDAQYDKALQLLRDTDTMAEILWHVLNEPGGSYSDWSSLVTTAHMALVSRAFDDHDCVKLIPLLDMVQHSGREETIQHSTKQDGTVVVTSQRDLLPGEELFTHYAPHLDPDEFLVLYGFVP